MCMYIYVNIIYTYIYIHIIFIYYAAFMKDYPVQNGRIHIHAHMSAEAVVVAESRTSSQVDAAHVQPCTQTQASRGHLSQAMHLPAHLCVSVFIKLGRGPQSACVRALL
jgi:hypothetical protein